MGLLQAIQLQTQIGLACLQLGDSSDETRYNAMLALRECGPAALSWVRIAAKRSGHPRMQLAAAVVLHWLGDPEGMAVLVEAIQCKLSADPIYPLLLESAFIAIGPPDATTALLRVWDNLPDGINARLTMTCICRIWATLKDPRVLDTLGAWNVRIADLFEQTVPAFGEMAIPMLRRLTLDPDWFRRRLAARTLRHIPLMDSFAALTPLLRDPDPNLRSEIPPMLEATGGVTATARELSEAIRQGYATPIAVQHLVRARPMDLYETLLCLVERGSSREIHQDEAETEALHQALPILARAPLPNARLIPSLCRLLEHTTHSASVIATARALGTRGQTGETYDAMARTVLWRHLTLSDPQARSEIAIAQGCLGEPFGNHLHHLLEECRPQANLLEKLQTVLRGGPDAPQAASQAVQQVSQWFTRFSKETVERWNAPTAGQSFVLRNDPRLPDLLRQMLANSLKRLSAIVPAEETEPYLTDCVAILRLLGRLGSPPGRIAQREALGALHCVKQTSIPTMPGVSPFPHPVRREVAGMVRAAAVETLLLLYGADSFPLFLEALYVTQPEVNQTAITALGRLGDVRALAHLQPIASNSVHPLCSTAIEAIAGIKRTNPEMMTLLRGSSASDAHPETLLRPASGVPPVAPDLLLRPSSQGGDEAVA